MIDLIIVSVLALFLTGFAFVSKQRIYGIFSVGIWIALAILASEYTAILIFSLLMSFYIMYDTFVGGLNK